MEKLIFLLAITLLYAFANAQNNTTIVFWNQLTSKDLVLRTDDYVNANRRHYNSNILNLDLQIETFKELYTQRVNILDVQRGLLLKILTEIDSRLYPLELLSDSSKSCVNSFKPLIPTMEALKTSLQNCIATASNQLYSLYNRPLSTQRSLETYYKNNFEKLLANCNQTHGTHYILCISNAIEVTNSYTQTMEKSFNTQLETAKASAQSYINQAIQCSFSLHNKTVSAVARASTLIEKCILQLHTGESEEGHICKSVHRVQISLQDYYNATIKNPLYGLNETVDCIVLESN